MYDSGDKMNITIRDIDEDLYRQAKARAALMETTIGRVLNQAIERWLEEEERGKGRKGFTRLLSPIRFGKGTEHASERVDELLYGGRE